MRFIFIIACLAFLVSCNKDKSYIEIEHSLDAFETIELNSSFDVELVEDSAFFVEVKGMAHIVNQVEFTVVDGQLRIKRNSKNDWLHPKKNKVTLVIHAAPLREVVLNEACSVTTRGAITSQEFGLVMKGKAGEADLDLNCDIFYFWNNAPTGGKVTLNGQCNTLKLWTTAIVTVDAQKVSTQWCYIENGSKGDCSVNVSSFLEYSLTAQGNIRLYGNPPQINVIEHSGEGELIEL